MVRLFIQSKMLLFYVFFALVFGLVDCKNYTNCLTIPGKFQPSQQLYIDNGPYVFVWAIDSVFDCAQLFFTRPRFGFNNYAIALTTSQNYPEVSIMTLDLLPNNKSLVGVECSGNQCKPPITSPPTLQLNLVDYDSSANGTYFCYSSCNGTAFYFFHCFANNMYYANEMERLVNSMRGVPNGKKIHLAQHKCPENCPNCAFMNI